MVGPTHQFMLLQFKDWGNNRKMKILIGGDFTEIGNYRRGRLPVPDLDGTLDTTFEAVQGLTVQFIQ